MHALRFIELSDPHFQDETEAFDVQRRINRVYAYLVGLGFKPPANATIDFQTSAHNGEIDITSWTPVILVAEKFMPQSRSWVTFAHVR